MTIALGSYSRLPGTIDVIVIGAGHAGLSMSYLLREAGIAHLVLERGNVANAWRTERWDSLRLLTPNWQTRLPGRPYDGDDPDGYMTVPELTRLLEDYALGMPVQTGTTVTSVRRRNDLYHVETDHGSWRARAVIIATGACNQPAVPGIARDLPVSLKQMTPFDYHSPDDVPEGGVLVVGASATGLQLADELLTTRRPVMLAAGEHVRMPRRYRGKDIFHWLQRSGIHDQSYQEIDDLARGRRLPSPQLVGSAALPILDINHLQERGASTVGRLAGARDGELLFSGSLGNVCALADLKMQRLLKQIDEVADRDGAPPPERFAATRVPESRRLRLQPEQEGIRTVIWATGFRPDYRWLQVPVLDRKGQLRHQGGVVDAPGLYVLGLPLMRKRKSSFIYGIEDDARDIAAHLQDYLTSQARRQAHDLYQDAKPG